MNKFLLTYISYFQIFALIITAVILTFFPFLLSYKQFVVSVGITTALLLIYNFLRSSAGYKNVIRGGGLVLLLFFLYSTTQHLYTFSSDKYVSFYLVLYGQTLPSVLFSCLIASKEDVQNSIKKQAPILGIIFTVIGAMTAFFTTTTTTGGYIDSKNGLNYQTTSYLTAYAAGLMMYYFVMQDEIKWPSVFNHPIIKKILPLLVAINFLSCLISGGRGGFVLFLIQLIVAFLFWLRKNGRSSSSVARLIVLLSLVSIIGYFVVRTASNSTIETSGFERIVGAIRDNEDSGRSNIRARAILSFKDSPILGHGIGSIFYEIGEYSHNCFTDILVEAGVIGCIIFLAIIRKFYMRMKLLIRLDVSDYFWLVIFLNGFIMSLFSGYYIANIPMWWAMAFVFSKKLSC